MIELVSIDRHNLEQVLRLEVAPAQRAFVASNAVSLAQAGVQPECIPLAICEDGTPVGFLMYCIDEDDGEWWLYRLMVDARHQRRGTGRRALALLLARIQAQDPARHRMMLGVHPESAGALALYNSTGFTFTGEVFGGEHIMALHW